MTITKMPLSALHAPEKNIRKHTDKQLREYVRSLQMFGQVKPLVVDGNGEIICGNGLYLALMQLNATECDCYVMPELTGTQKKKLMLADNRVYELGITDIDVFEQMIHELDGELDVPGWDDELLSTLNAGLPEVDEMVSDYGNFKHEDTERINRRVPQPSGADYPPEYAAEPPQHPSAPIQEQEPASDSPDAPVATVATGSPIGRYVICPKCGERICL